MISARVHFKKKGQKTRNIVAQDKHELQFFIFLYVLENLGKKMKNTRNSEVPYTVNIFNGTKMVTGYFSMPNTGKVEYIVQPRNSDTGKIKLIR